MSGNRTISSINIDQLLQPLKTIPKSLSEPTREERELVSLHDDFSSPLKANQISTLINNISRARHNVQTVRCRFRLVQSHLLLLSEFDNGLGDLFVGDASRHIHERGRHANQILFRRHICGTWQHAQVVVLVLQ